MNISFNKDDVIAHYLQCKSAEQTARYFQTTRKRVAGMLKKAGVYQPRTIRLPADREAEIVNKWKDGQSQSEIARDMRLSQAWVGRFLRKKGVLVGSGKRCGERHSNWKGGKHLMYGYIRKWIPRDHPLTSMANHDGYVMEHRLVMAEYLGRRLEDHETVHHINSDRSDNRIENLQLRQGKHGKGVVYKCIDCGSCNVKEVTLD